MPTPRSLAVFALVLVVSCTTIAEGADVLAFYETSRTAEGTYYSAASLASGHCSIPTNDMDLQTVAIAKSSAFMDGAVCGMCVQITANGTGSGTRPITGSFTALVADSCPTCDAYGLDLRNSAPDVGPWGAWTISWVAVDCPVGSLKLKYQFQGSNPNYVKIKVINPLIPVAGVKAMSSSGDWVSLSLTADGWFESSSSTQYKVNPVRLQVTSIKGEVVEDSLALGSIPEGTRSSVYSGSSKVQFVQGGGGGKGQPGSGGGDGLSSAALLESWLTAAVRASLHAGY